MGAGLRREKGLSLLPSFVWTTATLDEGEEEEKEEESGLLVLVVVMGCDGLVVEED